MANQFQFVVFLLFTLHCNTFKATPLILPELKFSNEETTCDCQSTLLVSDGGFSEKYPRYVGTWYMVGSYHNMPMYMCVAECQALTDKMVRKMILLSGSNS